MLKLTSQKYKKKLNTKKLIEKNDFYLIATT